MHILFVTGDVKPAVLGVQIAHAAQNLGATISVAAEGPSRKRWEDAGFKPQQTTTPFDLPYQFSDRRPDVIVAGLSSPGTGNNILELCLSEIALREGIPLVFIDDDWGSFNRRSPGMLPNLYLTIDALSHELLQKARPARAYIMGDDAVGIKPSSEAVEAVESIRSSGRRIMQVAGNKNPRTRTVLELSLEIARLSPDTVLIPRFHPGAAPAFKAECEEAIASFESKYPDKVTHLPGISSDHLAALADATLAVGGTAIKVACHSDRVPLLAWSPDIGQVLLEETGAEHHMLVTSGLAVEVTEPRALGSTFLGRDEFEGMRQQRRSVFEDPYPFAPDLVAKKVIELGRIRAK